MNNLYNNSNNFNLNSFLQLFLLVDAERDSFNNLVCKRSALKTLIAPAFLLLVLGVSLYILISNDLKLMYLIYIIAPIGIILFLCFFFNSAKSTYVIKVSKKGISKKDLLKREVLINYPDIVYAEILMAGSDNLEYAPALSFIKMSLAIKSKDQTIVIPVFIKGFVEFYKIFKQNFPGGQSQNVLKDIALNFMHAGIDLDTSKTIQNQNFWEFASPFEGF